MIFPRIRIATEGERNLSAEVFGHSLPLDDLRIVRMPWPFTRAFVAGRWFGRDWMFWPERSHAEDLAAGTLQQQAVFVHELVHIWQSRQGVNLIWAKIRAGDSADSYRYPVHDACHWQGLNIEQQAMVVEHRFRLSRGMKVPADMAFYDRVCPIRPEPDRKNIA